MPGHSGTTDEFEVSTPELTPEDLLVLDDPRFTGMPTRPPDSWAISGRTCPQPDPVTVC